MPPIFRTLILVHLKVIGLNCNIFLGAVLAAILGAATATNVKKENKKRKILANAVAMLLQAL